MASQAIFHGSTANNTVMFLSLMLCCINLVNIMGAICKVLRTALHYVPWFISGDSALRSISSWVIQLSVREVVLIAQVTAETVFFFQDIITTPNYQESV